MNIRRSKSCLNIEVSSIWLCTLESLPLWHFEVGVPKTVALGKTVIIKRPQFHQESHGWLSVRSRNDVRNVNIKSCVRCLSGCRVCRISGALRFMIRPAVPATCAIHRMRIKHRMRRRIKSRVFACVCCPQKVRVTTSRFRASARTGCGVACISCAVRPNASPVLHPFDRDCRQKTGPTIDAPPVPSPERPCSVPKATSGIVLRKDVCDTARSPDRRTPVL